MIYLASYMCKFLQAKGSVQATVFVFPDGTLMLSRKFDATLRQLLTCCGLQMSVFKGHSFRIGAASAAALHEESDDKLRLLDSVCLHLTARLLNNICISAFDSQILLDTVSVCI